MITANPTLRQRRRRVLIAWNHTDLSIQADVVAPADAFIDELTSALADHGLEVLAVNAEDNCDRLGDAVVVFRPDIILNLIDHFHGDALFASAITGVLDVFEYSYIGGQGRCIDACQDRLRCHLLLSSAGLPVTPFVAVWQGEELPELGQLRYPVIISQTLDDIYHEPDHRPLLPDFEAVKTHAGETFPYYDAPFVIEEYIGHRRIHVVVVADRALAPCEVKRSSDGYEVEQAVLERQQSERAQAIALASAETLGCRDWAQVEIVMTEGGELFVTDVNATVPLWQPESCFAVAAQGEEDGTAGVLYRVVRSGLERVERIEAARRADQQEETEAPDATPAP